MRSVTRELLVPNLILGGRAAELARANQTKQLRNLWDAEFRVFSQWGEDGILSFLCDSVAISKPRILEIGAGNFLESNSRYLWESRGGSAFLVDARSDLKRIVRSYPGRWRGSLWSKRAWISASNVAGVFSEAKEALGGVDIFILDLDGNDFWIARALDLSTVSIVVVEYNPCWGADASVTVPFAPDFDRTKSHFSNIYFGTSLRAWINLFHGKSFRFVGSNRAGNNAFFVRNIDEKNIPLSLPDTEDLARFVDWRVMEARDEAGKLTFTPWQENLQTISDLPLVETLDGRQVSVGTTIGLDSA